MSEAPFQLERLDHLVLRTQNVERLVSFYCSLGCTEVRRIDTIQLVQLSAGVSMIDIVFAERTTADSNPNMDHFALRVSPFDADDVLAFCAANDIPAEAPDFLLLGADGFGPAIYIQDPDGNRLELKGPPVEPRPDQSASSGDTR